MKTDKEELLEKFIKEFFPFSEFKKIGMFTKEMKGDYKAQAKRVCEFFGYKTVYEYGAKEFRAHVTFGDPDDPAGLSTSRPLYVNEDGKLKAEPFITVIPSIYD